MGPGPRFLTVRLEGLYMAVSVVAPLPVQNMLHYNRSSGTNMMFEARPYIRRCCQGHSQIVNLDVLHFSFCPQNQYHILSNNFRARGMQLHLSINH